MTKTTTSRVPFIDKLRRHRESREVGSVATLLRVARLLASEKHPTDRDLEAVDEALREAGKDTQFLEDLVRQFEQLIEAEGAARGAPSAREQFEAASKRAREAAETLQRETAKLRAHAEQAEAASRRALQQLESAQAAEKSVRDIRRSIARAIDPDRVESVRTRIAELGEKIAQVEIEGAPGRLAEARRSIQNGTQYDADDIERLRKQLPELEAAATKQIDHIAELRAQQAALEASLVEF